MAIMTIGDESGPEVTEAAVSAFLVICPKDNKAASLPWRTFCLGLGWIFDPEAGGMRALSAFTCPSCGEQHKIALRNDT